MSERMTDLERAVWAAFKGDITAWPAQFVEALAAARREGAEEMRERAAAATAFCCFECSRVIAALPLTPEEPI